MFFSAGGDCVRLGDTVAIESVRLLGGGSAGSPASFVVTSGDLLSGARTIGVADTIVRTTSFVLSGRVLDASSNPIDLAEVAVANERTGKSAKVLTPTSRTNGVFELWLQDLSLGGAAAGGTLRTTVSAPGLPLTTFALSLSIAEVKAGTAARELRLGASAPAPPSLAAVSPVSGPIARPTPVTLTGGNFTGATGARLGAVAALVQLRVISDTTACAVVPAGLPPGRYPLTLFGPAASSQAVEFTVSDPFASAPVARVTLLGATRRPAQVVQLNGSASSGEALGYAWSLDAAPEGAAELSAATPIVGYRAELPGQYVFRLTVTDLRERTASTTAGIEILASAPVARIDAPSAFALPDPLGLVPSSATTGILRLDGSGSFDPSSRLPLVFDWKLLAAPAGSTVTSALAGLETSAPILEVPFGAASSDAGLYAFQLRVTGAGGTATATATVRAIDVNRLQPNASAGLDRLLLARVLDAHAPVLAATIPDPVSPRQRRPFIRLDGRASSDPRGRPLTYEWTYVSGTSPVTLSGAATPIPTFAVAVAGSYTFRLTVTNDARVKDTDDVTIRLRLEGGNAPPNAEAVTRNLSSGRRGTRSRVLRAVAAQDIVELDGTFSSDPDDPPPLQYAWTQTRGAPIVLVPSPLVARPKLVLADTGRHVFRLMTRDARGAFSKPFEIAVDAVASRTLPPAVSVVSSSPTTQSTGESFSPDDDLASPRSLRVRLPATVLLSAFSRPSPVSLTWQQVAGPVVVTRPAAGLSGSVSAIAFEPTTAGILVFRARGSQLDESGLPTGEEADALVRVLVDGPGRTVPVAAFRVVVAGLSKGTFSAGRSPKTTPVVRATTVVTLDGSASEGDGLSYAWAQTAGPEVVLSEPLSAVTTFVVPDLGDVNSHQYSFQLFVDNGQQSEPAPGTLEGVPDNNIAVAPGINLISVPLDPSVEGKPYDADDLLRDAGGTLIARALPNGRFSVHVPGAAPFAVEGNRAYVVHRAGPLLTMPLAGVEWPQSHRTVTLSPGLNLLGYPRPVPAGKDLASLVSESGATYAVVYATDGRAVPYLPGLSSPQPIVAGQGILLIVPSEVTISLSRD